MRMALTELRGRWFNRAPFAMKPIIFALVATACYAVCNVLLELKFSKLNQLTLMIVYASVIWLSAVGLRQLVKTNDPSFNFPVGTTMVLAIVLGLICPHL